MTIFFRGIFLIIFASMYTIDAQQVTKRDTISGNVLITTMDSKVSDGLADLEDKCAVTKSTSSNSGTKIDSEEVEKPKKVLVPSRALTQAEICRQNPQLSGFKIQLAVVKSMEEANEVRTYFRSKYPDIKVMIDAALRPNYKILAGSYFTKQGAQKEISRIKGHFKNAVPVTYKIYCNESK